MAAAEPRARTLKSSGTSAIFQSEFKEGILCNYLTFARLAGAWPKKVRALRAKPMVSLLVDKSVMGQFLVDTLEAREPVSPQATYAEINAG